MYITKRSLILILVTVFEWYEVAGVCMVVMKANLV